MKPPKKQIEVSKIIESHAQFWQSTNDINSPTHYSEIENDIYMSYDETDLTENEEEKLIYILTELYNLIKELK